MTKEEIGAKIRQLRKAYGLTQKELADLSGISLRNVIDIERGSANPSLDGLTTLCLSLGLELKVEVKKNE
ncbi:MAG: helix-turn-helix domain-containing protein [Ignavibacteriales bacterium]|jgi:Helix-turn-helix.|nr:MAG: helix-turn-helix transcriptional regulator [Ignavibacteriaceae bacterium]MBW7873201.1 helix-turn-helix transcriptional regulator [Ignavibacteria bacterium]MCZ2142843.1 helix-turn-helix domain-containing protein [Ignavibacteriales bacterium]OQY70370.1 MAG: hypothetical protein B6D45_11315 [Ignavibacteriales bacterium UTCHB3]MBV6443937.1 hypothetical protein [Ignavibacteriaceae bacterium]